MELCKGETEGLGPGTAALELEPRVPWDLEMELRNLKPLTHCKGRSKIEAWGLGPGSGALEPGASDPLELEGSGPL